jgi:hypothetical protein
MSKLTIAGRQVAVGIVQSRSGDGIHDLIGSPTNVVLITPHLVDVIHDALAAQPCSSFSGGRPPARASSARRTADQAVACKG